MEGGDLKPRVCERGPLLILASVRSEAQKINTENEEELEWEWHTFPARSPAGIKTDAWVKYAFQLE